MSKPVVGSLSCSESDHDFRSFLDQYIRLTYYYLIDGVINHEMVGFMADLVVFVDDWRIPKTDSWMQCKKVREGNLRFNVRHSKELDAIVEYVNAVRLRAVSGTLKPAHLAFYPIILEPILFEPWLHPTQST